MYIYGTLISNIFADNFNAICDIICAIRVFVGL